MNINQQTRMMTRSRVQPGHTFLSMESNPKQSKQVINQTPVAMVAQQKRTSDINGQQAMSILEDPYSLPALMHKYTEEFVVKESQRKAELARKGKMMALFHGSLNSFSHDPLFVSTTRTT